MAEKGTQSVVPPSLRAELAREASTELGMWQSEKSRKTVLTQWGSPFKAVEEEREAMNIALQTKPIGGL